ncbi:DNA-3-methyladenine glycosylase [Clostridium sp. DSM 8431]|uniref:DNA-3-methyladenine glycosylase n=1 Tax=Clostridium sp. DSM 8431 TaxID=1761781 RepID=UPI0008E02AA9|nr:DNA-3-methyladenine glycosylase [Clostridium sp. DSM 8431]SFU68457.1 DNA-3-methyladenine glycosylase [Clostridium sp. DSM 8431]
MEVLREEFYGRKTLKVAKELLGKILVREIDGKIVAGKIVETEAYLGVTDKAAHVYGGKKTERLIPMYGQGGTAYVYNIYGMYACLNAITESVGEPQGVLIRAVEPLIGLDYMANRRCKKPYKKLTKKEDLNLTSGPSKLCMAMDITKRLTNTILFDGEMYIVKNDSEIKRMFEKKESPCGKIIKSKRIGIDYAEEATDYLYRFYYEDNPYVSKKDKKKE